MSFTVNKSQALTLGFAPTRTTSKALTQRLSFGFSATTVRIVNVNRTQPLTPVSIKTVLFTKSAAQGAAPGFTLSKTAAKPVSQGLSFGFIVAATRPGGVNLVQPLVAGFAVSKIVTKAVTQSLALGFLFPRSVTRTQPLSLGFSRTTLVTKADSQSLTFLFAPSRSTSKRPKQGLSFGFAVTAVVPAAPGLVSKVEPLVVGFALTLTGPQGGYFWGPTLPINPATGTVWMDTSVSPPILKKFSAGTWVTIG